MIAFILGVIVGAGGTLALLSAWLLYALAKVGDDQ